MSTFLMDLRERKFFWFVAAGSLLFFSFLVSLKFLCLGTEYKISAGDITALREVIWPTLFYFCLLVIPFFITSIGLRFLSVSIIAILGPFMHLEVLRRFTCVTSMESPLVIVILPVTYLIIFMISKWISKISNSYLATVLFLAYALIGSYCILAFL